MKKLISVALAVIMAMSLCIPAFAAEDETTLRFNEDGEFKILHISDCQDKYPAHQKMLKFIDRILKKYEPDLVVLGGDNNVSPEETKYDGIKELAQVFVDNEVYFTLVFGNHDREKGVTNEEQLDMYKRAAGKYCLAYSTISTDYDVDFSEDYSKYNTILTNAGTHALPIMSSTSPLKPAYMLYMFDSGNRYTHEDNFGYGCVNTEQINWFKTTQKLVESVTGGYVPSMAFQHIVVGEVMDVFYKEATDLSLSTKFCNDKNYDITVADFSKIKSGFLLEAPCPGVTNFGQFDALVEAGTVAVFSGHDHINNYTVTLNGVDIVNTTGCTYNSYGNDYSRGARLITIKEGTKEYKSDIILLVEEALDDGADFGMNKFSCAFFLLVNRVINGFFELFR